MKPMPANLPSLATARLPNTYESARAALKRAARGAFPREHRVMRDRLRIVLPWLRALSHARLTGEGMPKSLGRLAYMPPGLRTSHTRVPR